MRMMYYTVSNSYTRKKRNPVVSRYERGEKNSNCIGFFLFKAHSTKLYYESNQKVLSSSVKWWSRFLSFLCVFPWSSEARFHWKLSNILFWWRSNFSVWPCTREVATVPNLWHKARCTQQVQALRSLGTRLTNSISMSPMKNKISLNSKLCSNSFISTK